MRNKVEITGVNTSDLVVLSSDETMELIKRSHEKDKEARDLAFEGNLKLVLSVIRRFHHRGENLDDLFQVGSMGLLKAIDNFDFSHNVKFSTYAVPMIIGEIRRYLRDNSKLRISRSLKDIAYKTLQFKDHYLMEHQKEPSIEEIAEGLGIDVVDIVLSLEAMQEPVSIYTPIFNNGGDEIYLMDQIADSTQSEEKHLRQMMIEEGISRLTQREKDIIRERYYENKTQMEIAEELGISQAQVSRLEKGALKTINDAQG
jgi:RNA polymerase sporulation-specific sigma factor